MLRQSETHVVFKHYVTVAESNLKASPSETAKTTRKLPPGTIVAENRAKTAQVQGWMCVLTKNSGCWINRNALAAKEDFMAVAHWEGDPEGPTVLAGDWEAKFHFNSDGTYTLNGSAASGESSSVDTLTGKLYRSGQLIWARPEKYVETTVLYTFVVEGSGKTTAHPLGETSTQENIENPELNNARSYFLFFKKKKDGRVLCAIGNNDLSCE